VLKSPTQELVAEGVMRHIVAEDLVPGARINEQALARQLGVSRSPVRAVLAHFADRGILERRSYQGFVLARRLRAVEDAGRGPGLVGADLYQRMMRDMMLSTLEGTISQSALMRRYGIGRHELLVTLRRMTREGLAEPAAGHGWTFVRFDAEVIQKGYELRIILEPEVVLGAGYAPDRPALEKLRRDHVATLKALSSSTSWTDLFSLDARFHETLAGGSGNDFVVDVIRKQNSIRRLCEYLGYERLGRIEASLKEHLAILESILDGDMQWAAAQLRQHLQRSLHQTSNHFAQDMEDLRSGARRVEPTRRS
jgi:DNA-binding GntR family transcriptional regulator